MESNLLLALKTLYYSPSNCFFQPQLGWFRSFRNALLSLNGLVQPIAGGAVINDSKVLPVSKVRTR